MKLPNGFGSVYKLSGNRRNPWVARKTIGWEINQQTQKAKPVYQFIGYYPNRKDALNALVNFNVDPHETNNITFAEVYKRWSNEYFNKISNSNINIFKGAFNICAPVHNKVFENLKLDDYQKLINESGKNKPMLLKVKSLLSLMYEYGYAHEITSREKYEMIRYLDLSNFENPNSRPHKALSDEQLDALWSDINDTTSILLILVYTGLRINELLQLKRENLHLEDRWLYVEKSKTKNGIREVPIAEKIVPLFERWLNKPYDDIYIFNPKSYLSLMKKFKMLNITAHDCRHTCISLLTKKGVDERIIQQIVGHAGSSLTQNVYTHIDLKTKLDAINKI